jgi:hypothetical protein
LEGLACVEHDGGAAEIEAKTRACWVKVDAAWAPIWEARRVVGAAQNALAAAIDAKSATDDPQKQLAAAWCALRAAAQPKMVLPALGVCP